MTFSWQFLNFRNSETNGRIVLKQYQECNYMIVTKLEILNITSQSLQPNDKSLMTAPRH